MYNPIECNILVLNDDCFYHIFNFLPLVDWCSLRDTCTRFRTISDYCFDRQSDSFELKQIANPSSEIQLSEAKRVLRSFGEFMKILSINRYHFSGRPSPDCNVLMLYIDRYCLSLVDLELVNFKLNLATIERCGRLFSNLRRLLIDEWHDEEAFSGCLAKCGSLTKLEFIGLYEIEGDALANRRMESLRSFKMKGCRFTCKPLISFLTLNGQITELKLVDLYFADGRNSFNLFEDIANTLPKVESLSLSLHIGFCPKLMPVMRMVWLKKLKVKLWRHDSMTVNQFLKGLEELNTIEDLHLILFECNDESIRVLASLKSLKILSLSEATQLDGNMCKTLATGLSGLHEIRIIECIDTSLNEIKEFVLHIPNLRRIVFHLCYDARQSIAPESFLSLAEIRKTQAVKEFLLIFLRDQDLRDIQHKFESKEMKEKIIEMENVVRMLPLEKGHRFKSHSYLSRPLIGFYIE